MSKVNKLLPLIGLLLFIIIIYSVGFSSILKTMSEINLKYFLIAFLFTVPSLIIKTVKWNIFVKKFAKVSFIKLLKVWWLGFGIGIFTPGRLGDFSKAYFLRKELSIGKGLLTVFLDRVIDIISLLFLGLLSAIVLFNSLNFVFIAGFLIIFLIIALSLARNEKLTEKFLKPGFLLFVPEKYKEKAKKHFADIYKAYKKIGSKEILENVILTLAAWFFVFIQYYFLSIAFNLNFSFSFLCFAIPFILVIQSLPISFSGFGTREGVAIVTLGIAGISAEKAISYSLGIWVMDAILGLVGILVSFFIFEKKLYAKK